MDAVNLREALISTKYDLASIGWLVKDVNALMASGFHSVKVLHTPRLCNRVADHLAHFGSELGPGVVRFWAQSCPLSVNSLVAADYQQASG